MWIFRTIPFPWPAFLFGDYSIKEKKAPRIARSSGRVSFLNHRKSIR